MYVRIDNFRIDGSIESTLRVDRIFDPALVQLLLRIDDASPRYCMDGLEVQEEGRAMMDSK